MREAIHAITQYGDFTGTLSIDRSDMGGDLLWALFARVEKPKGGYWPVGFSVNVDSGGGLPGHRFSVTVYAVDAEVARGAAEVDALARDNDSIPVFAFRGSIEPSDLAGLLLQGIKRFEMVAQDRLLRDKPMVLLHDS